MYKSLYGLGSATHRCASHSLSAPSQLRIAGNTFQRCSVRMPWGDLKGFIFPGWIHTDGRILKKRKETKNPFCISHWHLNSCLISSVVTIESSFLFHSAPVSISLDTQVLCCFVFSSCNGLPGTCGFCLCFAHSSSFLSAAQCTSTLC